jgi:hypothetical protein
LGGFNARQCQSSSTSIPQGLCHLSLLTSQCYIEGGTPHRSST